MSPTVAEHAMTLLLAMVRRLPKMLEEQAKHNWSRLEVSAKATSVEGKTMVIVGYGQIGRELARRARAFGMRIVAVSRTGKSDELLDESHPLSDLKQVLGRADFVLLTIALTAETDRLFDAQMLAACKPGAFLVNVARGGLVDQEALAEALASGRLAGAALDVVDPEPLPGEDPLWESPNLIISPHFAGGASSASFTRLAEGVADNLRRLMEGRNLQHVVS